MPEIENHISSLQYPFIKYLLVAEAGVEDADLAGVLLLLLVVGRAAGGAARRAGAGEDEEVDMGRRRGGAAPVRPLRRPIVIYLSKGRSRVA